MKGKDAPPPGPALNVVPIWGGGSIALRHDQSVRIVWDICVEHSQHRRRVRNGTKSYCNGERAELSAVSAHGLDLVHRRQAVDDGKEMNATWSKMTDCMVAAGSIGVELGS